MWRAPRANAGAGRHNGRALDILLISGRGGGAELSRERAQRLARDLLREGHDVRWLCPLPADAAEPQAYGAELLVVRSPAPPFRRVASQLVDAALEHAASRTIRSRLPQVVHLLAYGGANSATVPWLADRLGAPVIVSAAFAPTVCHRGTLLHIGGERCGVWDDAQRCTRCCRAGSATRPSPVRAVAANACRVLGGWSPLPKPVDFVNRLESIVGGLLSASWILVPEAGDLDRFAGLGVPRQRMQVEPPEMWPVYEQFTSTA